MPRFFKEDITGCSIGDKIYINGEDARHISLSLRMKTGEKLIISDFHGTDFDCVISSFGTDAVELDIIGKCKCESEPDIKVHIFQSIPKGDKLDTVIQKCTELGAFDFTPVLSSRCISRPDEKTAKKKCERWQKIAAEAAKQSGRGIVPKVNSVIDFNTAIVQMSGCSLALLCYECEDSYSIKKCITDNLQKLSGGADVAIFIGPEGGISPEEAKKATEYGIISVGLGKRILRTETAPLFALSALMLLSNNAE